MHSMMFPEKAYCESAEALRRRLPFVPQTALVLGSGLGSLVDRVHDCVTVPYKDIPYLGKATAPSHAGKLICGRWREKTCLILAGRFHYYEGYSMEEVAFPVRVLRLLGVRRLVLTNAAGAINADFCAGDWMMIRDHLKFFDDSPLRGPNLDDFGPRFPDVAHLYSPALRDRARMEAARLGIPLHEGVYAYFPGPQYETPAEVRALAFLGADAVGMSTVPEALAAVHCGLEVAAFSCLTNMAAGLTAEPLQGGAVTENAAAAVRGIEDLLYALLD